jgi:hypothetical protein
MEFASVNAHLQDGLKIVATTRGSLFQLTPSTTKQDRTGQDEFIVDFS